MGLSRARFFEQHYWTFRRARDAYAAAPQPAIRWWKADDASTDVDRVVLEALEHSRSVLDIGAGDLEVKRKLLAAGVSADYRTVDPTREFPHDYADVSDAPPAAFDAALIFEVIEHLSLDEFFPFLTEAISKLTDDAVLVITTPNAEFVGSIFAGDITHVHAYRNADLAAVLHCLGFESALYRVVWRTPRVALRERVRFELARALTRGVLQVDYARGVLLVARRVAEPRLPEPATRA
jgi:hypothetical protein